jgi:hypothetical protein
MVNVPCTPGDANKDGNIDAGDLVTVLRIILELDAPTCGADANQDSNINIRWQRGRVERGMEVLAETANG